MNEEMWMRVNENSCILKTIWYMKHRWLRHVLRHNFLHDKTEGKIMDKATRSRNKAELLNTTMKSERLWTVERINIKQVKMETGQQMRMHVRNLLVTAEDYRRRMVF